jgi:hypothetical protein
MARPYFAAARDVASSPSGWASFIDAAGLKPNGRETCWMMCCQIWPCFGLNRFSIRGNTWMYLATEDLCACIDFVDVL